MREVLVIGIKGASEYISTSFETRNVIKLRRNQKIMVLGVFLSAFLVLSSLSVFAPFQTAYAANVPNLNVHVCKVIGGTWTRTRTCAVSSGTISESFQIPASTTLSITGSVTVSAGIVDSGNISITTSGNLTTSSSLNITSSGTVSNSGVLLNQASGAILNQGLINNWSTGNITSLGSMTNTGTINNYGYFDICGLWNQDGTFNNYGTFGCF